MSQPLILCLGKGKNFASPTSLSTVPVGDLFYGDIISVQVFILSPNAATGNNFPTPWDTVNNNDLALQMAIGDVNSTDVMTPLCYQPAWSKSAANDYFFADFFLNTALLKAALGSLSSYATTLEVKQDKGGNKTTIFQQAITIRPRAIGSTTVIPVAPDSPLSKEEALGTYQPRVGANGDIQRLVSPNGLYAVDLYVDNNGVFHTDPVTI